MAFKCALCELEIQVGEPMLADEKMNLAHEVCAKRGRAVDPPTEVHFPSVTVSPPPLPSSPGVTITVTAKVGGPGIGHPGALGEPCLLPSAPKTCSECQKPAISMCPSCHAYVHQDYGYNGHNCSARHEGKCAGAFESRTLKKEETIVHVAKIVGAYRNGKHVVREDRKKRGGR